ncbi:MAG TPA: sigma 54-interacting transcriptional regulator [Candidatus Binataceae bacterium]|nr:sigma 54-interacting transcriptional regulator [Candidatus Binataceae bacterium]
MQPRTLAQGSSRPNPPEITNWAVGENDAHLLLEIGNLLTTKLDPETLFDTIAHVLRRFLDIDRASLALYEPEHDEFEIVALALHEGSRLGKGWFIPHRGSRAGKVFDSRQPYFSTLGTDKTFFEDLPLVSEGMHFSVVIPMLVDDKPIGTFNVNRRHEQELSNAEMDLLARVANQIAIAVTNSRKFDSIRRQKEGLRRENAYLLELTRAEPASNLLLIRPSMQSWLDRLMTLAKVDATALIGGETGTGKGILARVLHDWSGRRDRPFVKCDCAALSPQLIESELFGHEKGAFTGAHCRTTGRFELAHGGTLFLDEIAEIPLETQSKLLGVLQDRQIQRVGATKPVPLDIRIIAATNRDLAAEVEAGRFRQDLYFRLNVVSLQLPPLRDTMDDILPLVHHFIQVYGRKLGRNVTSISTAALAVLKDYSWPGNIRELENVIERTLLLSTGSTLEIGSEIMGRQLATPLVLSGQSKRGAANPSEMRTLAEMETRYICEVLDATGWRISGDRGAASILGLHPNTLRSRMQRLRISRPPSATN